MKIAVIGVGYLGRFHAQKYSALKNTDLIGVCDNNKTQANKVANELNTKAFYDYRELANIVEAVSIVVPTKKHHETAKFFLSKGVHVLLEKPITVTISEADELINIAKDKNLVLQIGHLERFNPALMQLAKVLEQPTFIEAKRLAPFNPRGADVNVVLDLMIHDIDIIQSLLGCGIKKIDTVGVPVLTKEIDICNAYLEFENGCIANVSASRVSKESERKIRVFQKDAYFSVDFQEKTLATYRNESDENTIPDQSSIRSHLDTFETTDAIMDEIVSFVNAIKTGGKPIVSGSDGRSALLTALEISNKILKTRR